MPNLSSLNNIVAEMDIILPGGTISIPVQQFVQDFQFESSVRQAFTGSITLFDQGDTLENLLLTSGLSRQVRMRWNWESKGLTNAPNIYAAILTYSPTFNTEGITFSFDLVPTAIPGTNLDKRSRSYPEGRKISDIAREIAADRGWNTFDNRGRNTIEETKAPIMQPFNSTDETDLKFLNTLLPLAVSLSDLGGYRMFFDLYNVFHFHTNSAFSNTSSVKQYVFGKDGSGEVISFTPSDTSTLAMIAGAGNVTYRGQSSLDGAQTAKSGTTDGGLDREPDPIESTSASVPDHGSSIHSVLNIVSRDSTELANRAKFYRDRALNAMVVAELQVVGTHDLDVFDYCDVQYIRRNGQPHYMSGKYQVNGITHNYNNGAWTTTFALTRQGFNSSPDNTVNRQTGASYTVGGAQ